MIVSESSCLPEVCGDAPRYVDPDDIVAFGNSIRDCLSDERWRTRAIQRGLARAAEFTWDRCIDSTLTVYERISGQPSLGMARARAAAA